MPMPASWRVSLDLGLRGVGSPGLPAVDAKRPGSFFAARSLRGGPCGHVSQPRDQYRRLLPRRNGSLATSATSTWLGPKYTEVEQDSRCVMAMGISRGPRVICLPIAVRPYNKNAAQSSASRLPGHRSDADKFNESSLSDASTLLTGGMPSSAALENLRDPRQPTRLSVRLRRRLSGDAAATTAGRLGCRLGSVTKPNFADEILAERVREHPLDHLRFAFQ